MLAGRKDQTCNSVRCIGTRILLSEAFDHSRVTALRHTVAACAGRAGLADERLSDFVAAVNELLTNAVRHGGGQGHVRLWAVDDEIVCEVTDSGGGLPAGARGQDRPAPEDPGGRGLWLAAELTDALELTTGEHGTAVRISTRVG